jgi:peptide/nickel transport system substrate-binding protein
MMEEMMNWLRATRLSLLLSFLCPLFGCSDDETKTSLPAVVIGTTDSITDLDPANAYDEMTWQILGAVSLALYRIDTATGKIYPTLAEGDPQADSTGTVYTVKLRKGVKFADGTEIKAETFKYSIDRIFTIDAALKKVDPEDGLAPGWLVMDFVKEVTVVDDYTLKYELNQPIAFFRTLLSLPPYYPVNKSIFPADKVVASPFRKIDNMADWQLHHLDQTTIDITKLFGHGAYTFESAKHDKSLGTYGDYTEITLARNPDYIGEEHKNSKVTLKFVREASKLNDTLKAHEIDIAWRTLKPTDLQALKNDPAFNVLSTIGLVIRYMVFRCDKAPFDTAEARQAVAAAVDRDAIIQQVFLGGSKPLFSMVPQGLWSHKDSFNTKYGDRDLDKAKQLLTTLGYTTTNKLAFDLWYTDTHYGETEKAFAEALKAQIEETGLVEITLNMAPWNDYVQRSSEGEFPAYLLGWFPDYIDPDNYLLPFGKSDTNNSFGIYFKDTELDGWLDQAMTESELSKRTTLYEQIQDKWADAIPTLPLLQEILYLVTHKNVSLMTPSLDSRLVFETISVKD